MPHDSRVSKRYAQALFNAAKAEKMVAAVDADLVVITKAIQGSEEFRHFLTRPETTAEDKVSLFSKVFGDRVTSLTFDAIRLLVEKRRDDELAYIQLAFSELRRADEHITKAVITSSEPLDSKTQEAIIAKLEKDLGHKVESEFTFDPTLIGGVKIVYDNYVVDGTVRGQLDRMRDKLLYDVLKQA